MTHLSDYSYLDRGISVLFYLLYSIYVIFIDKKSRFENKKSVKTIVTVLLLLSMIFSIISDSLGTYVKYKEAFLYTDNQCITMPLSSYSLNNQKIVIVANTFLNISWAIKGSSYILIQLFWKYIAKITQETKNDNFFRSIEFKTYIGLGIFVFIYVSLQYIFINYNIVSSIAPEFVSNIEGLIIVILGLHNHIKLNKYRSCYTENINASKHIFHYIKYNKLLIISVFLDSFWLFIINIDYITTQLITHNKFFLDILTKIFNFGFSTSYLIAILLLYY